MRGVLVSPSKSIDKEVVSLAVLTLSKNDLDLEQSKFSIDKFHYFSSTIENRTIDLNNALKSDCDFIWMNRGGYGAVQILERINFNLLISNFKWIIGFSDITYFHAYLNNVLNLPSIHGTMPLNFKENSSISIDSVINVLHQKMNHYKLKSNEMNQVGTVSAKVIGGNLAILAAVTGSEMQSQTDGKILFIEDVGEHLYAIDRMLYTLKLSGQLEEISGLIVGGFTNIKDTDPGFGMSLEEIILSHVSNEIPVCFDFPAGHVDDNRAIVFNHAAELTITKGEVEFIQKF